jgi:hypothetical protein
MKYGGELSNRNDLDFYSVEGRGEMQRKVINTLN